MTANEKRKAVIAKYKTLIGRNYYSQPKRDYCFKKYKDGKYYSDCSSSISYAYKEAGFGFGILNTVGMYQSDDMVDVNITIKNGIPQEIDRLRVGDMLLFAGSDSSRAYAGYVGHVEMIYSISGDTVTLCGHGSGRPSLKNMKTYCRSRRNSKSSTKLGNKGLIRIRRFIQDDITPVTPQEPSAEVASTSSVTITGGSVYVRTGPGTNYSMFKVAHMGDKFEKLDSDGWTPILFDSKVRWMSKKYIDKDDRCTGSTVNVRMGAGTSFPSVGVVHKGDKLSVVYPDEWVPVVIEKAVYWVSNKYAGISANARI